MATGINFLSGSGLGIWFVVALVAVGILGIVLFSKYTPEEILDGAEKRLAGWHEFHRKHIAKKE